MSYAFVVGPLKGSVPVGDIAKEENSGGKFTCVCEYQPLEWEEPHGVLGLPTKVNETVKSQVVGPTGRFVTVFEVTLLKGDRYRVKKRTLLYGTRQRVPGMYNGGTAPKYNCIHVLPSACSR